MTQNKQRANKILKKIIQKRIDEITFHELHWLFFNVLYTEADNRGIFCLKSPFVRLWKLYEQYNPSGLSGVDKEEFLEQMSARLRRKRPKTYGLTHLSPKSGKAPKHIKDILLSSGECPYGSKAFRIYTFNIDECRMRYEQKYRNGCTDLRCSICHGAGIKTTIKVLMIATALMQKANPIAFSKLLSKYRNLLHEFVDQYGNLEDKIVLLINRSVGLSKDTDLDSIKEALDSILEEEGGEED
jgi:hypothetical protein